MGKRNRLRPAARGMAAFMVVVSILQFRVAAGEPGDIFTMPAPVIGSDPPKATDIKDGDASVSTQTGALQYSYPIQVPAGRNGMAPQLAISYSSQAPTYGGLASGWSLSIPMITEDHSQGRLRTRSLQVEQEQLLLGVDPKKDDRFVSSLAGGRPLIWVQEPTGVASDVYLSYRAQNDTSFARYERMLSSAPYRWRVRTTDGKVLTFGESARMPGCLYVSDQYAPLTGMVDAFNNEVRYEYNQTISGECKLVRIAWGRNDTVPLADFAQVVFQYEVGRQCNGSYVNAQTDYRSGVRLVTGASPLQSITATAHEPGNPAQPVHTRIVYLNYDSQTELCTQSHAPVRMLRSIQEVAWGADSPIVSLPTVTFDYNSPTVALAPPPSNTAVPWGRPDLGWGYRNVGDGSPSVETMFLDIDGDGLQDLVENVSGTGAVSECRARWRKNYGANSQGVLFFGAPASPLSEIITLPRLKWRGSTNPPPVAGSPVADPANPNYEVCSLNGQTTAFMNAQASPNACHHAPGTLCRPGSDPNDPVQYCDPGGTRCPTDPGGPWGGTRFRTVLAYRWLDMDSDGLVDLVTAVQGDIDSYDIERGNETNYTGGEPSMYGIPGLNQWPACPTQAKRCKRLENCLEEHNTRTCDGLECVTNWVQVANCVTTSVTTGCANVIAKEASQPDGAPTAHLGTKRHPYERCEGLHPWLIYKNQGRGQFATTPVIKYQPVPLESTSGDSGLTSPRGFTSENHSILDFDGDGRLDAVVRETEVDGQGNASGGMAWQVWLGDGTGGFDPQMYVFPTRKMLTCVLPCWGENALSSTGGTFGGNAVSLAGLIDANGDGAQDHWLAQLPDYNANIAFNYGTEIKMYGAWPGTGELTTTSAAPYSVKPGNDAVVTPTDPPFPFPTQQIKAGKTHAHTRVTDVDHDGRVDIVGFESTNTIPKVFFNVGGQFNVPGVDWPSTTSGQTLVGLRRETEATISGPDNQQWRLNTDLMDLDGDGLAEGVSFPTTTTMQRALPESSQPPRLLRAVHNGRGAHSIITYSQMHDGAVVEQHPESMWPDGRPKASPRSQWVVKSLQVQDDHALTDATTQYRYKNPRYGADDAGQFSFRGFEEVTTTKPSAAGTPSGARTIERYGFDIDWSGRLVETVVMPSAAEAATDARTIDKTSWQQLPLFGSSVKTYHPYVSEHFTCSNGQTETACKTTPAGYTQTTSSWTAYPTIPTKEQLWLEASSLLQASATASDGDRLTLRTYQVDTSATKYMAHPLDVERQHRLNATMVVYAKSRQTWDTSNGTQTTDEVWVDTDDTRRAITRFDYDTETGNRTKTWKPVQWAPNPNPLTNLNRTTFEYDARKLFVARETNELGHVFDYLYEYGTGTKLETLGPNAPPCAAVNPPTCPQGQPQKEDHRIRVDGLGRMIQRYETFASPGSDFWVFKVETNAYVDGPAASVTHQGAIDYDGNLNVRYTEDKTELDGHGRPIKKVIRALGSAPADQITTFVYRNDGTLAEVRVPDPTANNANTVSYTYTFDSLGRSLTIRRPDGANTGVDLSYDGLTQTSTEVLGSSLGNPASTKTVNDSFARLVRVDELLSSGSTSTWASTSYDYDPADNIDEIVDPEGVTTVLAHDFAGRRTQITRAGRTWSYTYDRNGNVSTETSPCSGVGCVAAHTTSIAYDALDRPLSKSIAPRELSQADLLAFGSSTETFLWDLDWNGKGRLYRWRSSLTGASPPTSESYPSWNIQGQRYNLYSFFSGAGYSNLLRGFRQTRFISGELAATYYGDLIGTQCSGYSQLYYDNRGLPQQVYMTPCDGGVNYSYVIQNRNVAGLVTKRFSQNGSGVPVTYVESNWAYDKLGRVASQGINKGSPLTQVARQDLAYNGNDDPHTLDHWLGNSNHKQLTFEFDKRHQLTHVGEAANAFTATYGYDDAGRFESALETAASLSGSDVKPRDVTYQYAGIDPEQVTALVSDQGTYASYTYDLAGNQTTRSYPTTGESWNYVYDGKNQLRRATRKLNGVVTGSEEYWYDEAGARQNVVKRDANGDKTEMIWFIGDVEAHYNASGAPTKIYGHVMMGTTVARFERTSDAPSVFEYQFHGLANNTLAAVDQTSGTVNASFVYAPFGEIIEATDGGGLSAGIDKHRRRMNDKYVDEIGGLAYYGFRYYDKTSMTWTQSDPLYRFAPDAAWTSPRQALLYTMSLNNPIRYIDPDGRSARTAVQGAIAGAQAGGELAGIPGAIVVGAVGAAVGWFAPQVVVGAVEAMAGGPGVAQNDRSEEMRDYVQRENARHEAEQKAVNDTSTQVNKLEAREETSEPRAQGANQDTVGHRKNKRESNREKHERGDERRKRDKGGEKGDQNRRPPRQKPPGHRGPWPPPPQPSAQPSASEEKKDEQPIKD
jgi:RHS repeat-associated protein